MAFRCVWEQVENMVYSLLFIDGFSIKNTLKSDFEFIIQVKFNYNLDCVVH